MKYLKQFTIIILVSFIGELLHFAIPLPVPASIYGLIIMFFCLHFKLFTLSSVKETGSFFIDIMPLMFIPAAVGLINSWDKLKAMWLPTLIITIVSTVAVMAVSGLVTQSIIRLQKKKSTEEQTNE